MQEKKKILVDGSYKHELEIPKSWAFAKFSDVIEIIGGSQPPKSEFLSEPKGDCVRLIQIRDYKSDANKVFIPRAKAKRFVTKDEIMIGRYGPPIFQILRGLEGAYNVALMKAKPRDDIFSNDYLFWYLSNKNLYNYVESASDRTAGQSGVNKKHLEQYPVAVPPLPEQKRIVAKLDEVLAQVDTIKARLDGIPAILKRFRQSVLAAAVSGKLTEEWRGNTSYDAVKDYEYLVSQEKIYLAKKLTDEKTKILKEKEKFRLKESEEKNIDKPRQWIQLPFFEVCLLNRGFDLPTSKRIDGKYPILSAGGLIGYHNEAKVKAPVITVGRSGSVGQVFMVNEDGWPLNTALYAKDIGFSIAKYVYLFLQTMNLSKFASSTAVPTLNRNEFTHESVILPPKEEQKEIVRLVDQYFTFADTIEAQMKKAQARVDNLTQSILAKAFRGELVPQDPDDEPADELLKRIATARKEAEALAKAAKKAAKAPRKAAAKE